MSCGSEKLIHIIIYPYIHTKSSVFLLAYDFFWKYIKAMSERERFTTTLDSEILRQIKILAINLKRRTNDLFEEALRELLKKYEKKNKK